MNKISNQPTFCAVKFQKAALAFAALFGEEVFFFGKTKAFLGLPSGDLTRILEVS